jgi:two-component system heavy metal sensor histidine kinase CusS
VTARTPAGTLPLEPPADAARPGAAADLASTACRSIVCSHSISRRLAQKVALFTMLVLAVLFSVTWGMVKVILTERNAADLQARCELISDVLGRASSGGEATLLARLLADAPMRASTRLQVWRADGSALYADPDSTALERSPHRRDHDFTIATPALPGGTVKARYTVDYSHDAAMGTRWAWILTFVTLAAGAIVGAGSYAHVRRHLRPLRDLASQTRAISARRLDQRLALADPAEELLPWIEQFNALMVRLEQAYTQLEAFNADVAHELRTPLAALIGETEVALQRERPAAELRETMASNLEEMQRLSALVNDMLFLSQADRGAVARRGAPVSLAEIARQVAEYHEPSFEDAGLKLQVDGDARVAMDEPLVKRALSNLLGNAARFAASGSTVEVRITGAAFEGPDAGQVRVLVQNAGPAIDAAALPRLFDRFFRGDASRCCDDGQTHHGLGLAIVAAIARMHGGTTFAESGAGLTRVGFTLAATARQA